MSEINRKNGRLREMVEADLEQVLAWRNSERIRASMYTDQVISLEQHLAWYERIKEDTLSLYLIFEYCGEKAGVVNFSQLDKRNNKAVWGFYLGLEHLPQGTGTLMGELGLQWAFEQCMLRKLCGEAFAYNNASIQFHKRLGFQQEGCLQKHILKNGKYEDILIFALLEEQYRLRSFADE